MTLRVAGVLVWWVVAACNSANAQFVAWPSLDPDTLSFLLVAGSSGPSAQGPFEAEGPEGALSLPADSAVFVLSFERAWLQDLHARVDAARLMEAQLRERPPECNRCETICRGPASDVLYQPVGSVPSVFEYLDGAFLPVATEDAAQDLWLELPARWDCVTDGAAMPSERVDSWPTAELDQLFSLGEDGLVVTGPQLRRLGDDPSRFISSPASLFRGAVPWGDHHALVAVYSTERGSSGRLMELDLGGGAFEVVREEALAINPTHILRDEKGIVLVGRDGGIVTSTDAVHFRASDVGTTEDLAWISRVPDQTPPYFIGSGLGRVFAGDPWADHPRWSERFVSTGIDYPVLEVFEVRGQVTSRQPDGRWLWARSSDRGSFERPFDEDEWRPVQVEPPRVPPECSLGVDDCGFARFPQATSQPHPHDGHVDIAATSCSRVLVAYPERGCASSFLPDGEHDLTPGSSRGLAGVQGGVVVLNRDGATFVPLE